MVRMLMQEEFPMAAALVQRVFEAFVAPDYPPEGVETFCDYLDHIRTLDAAAPCAECLWGYFEDGELAGVLAARELSHICLLFVSAEHHRKGIARALFSVLRQQAKEAGVECITVNASRYGLPAYEKLGFVATGEEEMRNGIRFTPMRYEMGVDYALRPWRMEDAALIVPYANNPRIAQNLRNAFPHPYTLADAENYVSACVDSDETLKLCRAIEVGGEPVGSIGIFLGQDVYEKTAEIGYWLAEPWWGRGIMTNAVRELCELAFQQYDILRIHAEVFSVNAASCRVLEKAGFTFEGVKRSSVCKNGCVMDSHIFALVREKQRPPMRHVNAQIAPAYESIDDVRKLFSEYADMLGIMIYFKDFDQELATLPGSYAPPQGRLFVARCEGQAIGCVALRPLEDDRCELKRLYVCPEFRGKHLGRRLAERVIKEAREIGYTQMLLNTLDMLPSSIALFHRLGFAETVPSYEAPQPGLVYMALDLSGSGGEE